jgi:hypothetical protein
MTVSLRTMTLRPRCSILRASNNLIKVLNNCLLSALYPLSPLTTPRNFSTYHDPSTHPSIHNSFPRHCRSWGAITFVHASLVASRQHGRRGAVRVKAGCARELSITRG